MKPALPRSLQGRLVVLVLGVVLLVLAGAAVLAWRNARHEMDELLDAHLAQAAALLVVQQAGGELDDDHVARAPVLDRYAPRVAFQVWHEGALVLRSANAPAGAPMSPRASGFETLRMGGTGWRVFGATGAERDVRVYVGEQLGSRQAILRALLLGLLMPWLAGLLVLALAVWWAVARGLWPLRRLSHELALRDAQTLQPVALQGAPSEMTPLLAALNGLFERIARLLESERRFTADAAHELRTPIAAIRTQAQVALGAAGDAERVHALRATVEGCDRATHLVAQLLTLSRLEAATPAGMGRVDLAEVAQRAVAEVAPQALDKQQALELDAPEACPVSGDAALLGVLVRNLVDNAIRYSPPGARVQVAVRGDAHGTTLTVDDSGPGLQPDDLRRLGERFFRVLGTGASGSGLGWSIVKRIAAAHGASVSVDRSPQLGGVCVRVSWPR